MEDIGIMTLGGGANTTDQDITNLVAKLSNRVLEVFVKDNMWDFQYVSTGAKMWVLLVSIILLVMTVCLCVLMLERH
jgi:hypothetical protein